jgi:hypothetical protein
MKYACRCIIRSEPPEQLARVEEEVWFLRVVTDCNMLRVVLEITDPKLYGRHKKGDFGHNTTFREA